MTPEPHRQRFIARAGALLAATPLWLASPSWLSPLAAAQGSSTTRAQPATPLAPAIRLAPAAPAAPNTNTGGTSTRATTARPHLDDTQAVDAAERHARAMADLAREVRALGFTGLREAADLDAIWFTAMAFDGTTAAFRTELDALSTEGSFTDRAVALWTLAALDLREGLFRESDRQLDALEEHLEDAAGADAPDQATLEQLWLPQVRFARAAGADKRGQEKVARDRYRRLADDLAEWQVYPELEQLLRLRLAMMEERRGDDPGAALIELAREGDADDQRRAAVVLGLQAEPAAALELYPRDFEDATGSARFRHLARLADWALSAEDSLRAQSLAWDAAAAARLSRDTNYALALLMEAHRMDDSLDLLIERIKAFDAAERADGYAIDEAYLDLWIELLRETERVDEAIALFEERAGELDQDKRSNLVQLYTEGGRHAEMVAALEAEIAAAPDELAWRELLSRDHLERGDRAAAEAVWRPFVDAGGAGFGEESLLVGFDMLSSQGLDDLAIEVAERALETDRDALAACLLLFGLHQRRGDLDAAEEALERMQALAPEGAPERLDLAEAWERLGRLDRAVEVLEGVVASRGRADSGEDLAMHLAWLYSEVGDEERALEEWRTLWTRVDSVARRRYVEDRLMTVAARLGVLADIAIDLETKLIEGTASEREAGLLVRLYTTVQDAVSATEVLEEFLAQGRGAALDPEDPDARAARIDALQEKGQIYLACLDYFHFEETVRELIEVDPEGEGEYLQQLAMSQLERGRPDEARATLERLRLVEGTGDGSGNSAAEFQAGVLALAGLREEAAQAYRAGIAQNPDRIESWLLLGNLMKDNGATGQAIAMFQQLAETADEDDLFMIAIDGLLNLEAGERALRWARRLTWERLAGRSDKPYLYQLSAELSDELNEPEGVRLALQSSLAIVGERRSTVLRELIERTQASDQELSLAFSRRLLGLGEFVPPEVYLDLGEAFLEADDVVGAERTFRKANEVPDRASFERQTAELFESYDYPEEALAVYQRALSGSPTDAGLLNKVGELHERLGDDALAHELYGRTLDLLLARLPLVSTQADERDGAQAFWMSRNVDDFDRFFPRARLGWLTTLPPGAAADAVAAGIALLRADVASARALEDGTPDALENAPRILHRARFVRDLALIAGHPEWLVDFDHWLLVEGFPDDPALLAELADTYLKRGYLDAARGLVERARDAGRSLPEVEVLVGLVDTESLPHRLELAETRALLLPLLIDARDGDLALLLARTNYVGVAGASADSMGLLLNAAMFIGDEDLTLRIGREWIRVLLSEGSNEWQLRPVLERMEGVLVPDDYRALCRYLAQLAMEEPEKGQAVMGFLPALQAKLEIELFDTDQLFELLDAREDLGYGYGVDSLVELFPADLRASVLRSVLPRLLPTARARFCLSYLNAQREPLSDEIADLLYGAVKDNLKDAPEYIEYEFSNLANLQANQDLGLRLLELYMAGEPNPRMQTALLGLYQAAGRLDDALALGRELWPDLVIADVDQDWQLRQVRDQVREVLAEHDFDWLYAYTAEQAALEPVERVRELVGLLVADERFDEARTVVDDALAELAAEQVDERLALLDEWIQLSHRTAGATRTREELADLRAEHLEERLALLLNEAEGDPADERVQAALKRLVSEWTWRLEPSKALPYAEQVDYEPVVPEERPSNGLPPGFANLQLAPGTMIVINGQVFTAGGGSGERPTIERVAELAEEGDDDAAARMLRRLWRDFQAGVTPEQRYGFLTGGGAPTPAWTWPAEDAEPKEQTDEPEVVGEPETRLGGLVDYAEPEEREVVPRQGAFEVLAGFDWAMPELEKLLRTRAPDQLDSDNSRQLITALLDQRIADPARPPASPVAARDALLARFDAGRSGKLDQIELLTLLDAHPGLVSAEAEAALDTLGRALRSGDLGPLRALARLHAQRGDLAEATRLYRWLATQVAPIGAWFGDELARLDARELFEEVRDTLAADPAAQRQVTADIVAFATAGSEPWSRQTQDRFAIEVWTELLPPAEAAEELADLLAELSTDTVEEGLQRGLALEASVLYLHSGAYARAIECLELGIAVFDVALSGERMHYGGTPSYPNALSSSHLAALFPAEPEPELAELLPGWYPRVADALVAWHADGRLRAHTFAQAFALAVWRHHQLTGEVLPQLAEVVQRIQDQDPDLQALRFTFDRTSADNSGDHPDPVRGGTAFFVLDAAELVGAEDLAYGLAQHMAEEGSLGAARLALHLGAVQEREGPAAALAAAEETLERAPAQALLVAAADAAEAAGAPERAAELRAKAQTEAAAWQALHALQNPEPEAPGE